MVTVADGADANLCPYLRNEIRSLNDLHVIPAQNDPPQPEPEPARVLTPTLPEPKPVIKKTTKPKWFKL